ncbi:6-bladed beta-propeller [Maribellus maritimus]|uniref:6-bladed beta-propeller n=1 Tax=Maribellus maritimus TaxID=2870838 RepID=UPI001EEB1DC2|nr:6-bladed beta-propeller [Maribellus maritimus]MCG6189367.1 6-bladed beta-propeller [Maribellus maritimus]
MKNKVKILIILFVIHISCSTGDPNTGDIRKIVLKETKDVQPVSSFASDIDYIELKYQGEVQPGRIQNVKLLDNEIIVKQRYGGETSLLRFSKRGEFLNQIGKNRIQNLRDIISYNNDFAVWDEVGIKVFSKNGEFQRKIFNVNEPGSRFFYSKSKFYLFHETNAPGYITEYSMEGKKENVFRPLKAEFENEGNPSVTELGKDNFHLFSPINDTIYVFSNQKLLPQYVFDGKPYPTYIEILKKAESMSEYERIKYIRNNQHWKVRTYLENDNFIFIDYSLGSYPSNIIIRKSDWQISYVKEFINDIDGGVWDDPYYLSDKDELYIPLTSYQISGHTIKNKKRHEFDEQKEKALQSDNPVILVCKLK